MSPMQSDTGGPAAGVNVIDIRREQHESSILKDITAGLLKEPGEEKRLPTLLLYDEAGLKLFEKITYLEEYYLTNAEIEMLEKYADNIAQRIHPNSIILELGSGNLRKVDILLKAIDRSGKAVKYFALDLSLSELQRTLAAVPPGTYEHVTCSGLLGTYDDGLEWLTKPENLDFPKTILFLGSSIGNFERSDAAAFLRSFADVLQPRDTFLLAVDNCIEPEKVFHAYNDKHGLTHQFVLNGLSHANRLFGKPVFDLDQWYVVGEYDQDSGRHQAFVVPKREVLVDGIVIKAGERIRIEESYKYSALEQTTLLDQAGLVEGSKWFSEKGDYSLTMLSRPRVLFPSKPEQYAAQPVPTLSEWNALWTAWDAVTREMIPKEELLSKPIKLRNACIFYLGHIPTFLDMHVTRATRGKPTEPGYYPKIFERGIDPDVDNPKQCHAHSEIPDDWPPAEEILDFQASVRHRVAKLYEAGIATKDRWVGRALWLGFEHELMHLETLLYMLVQSENTLPPPDVVLPDFEAMAYGSKQNAVPNEWIDIPPREIAVGMDDPENDSGPDRYFGWDNEKPSRRVPVPGFTAKARPISIAEYAVYLTENGIKKLPAAWYDKMENGNHNETSETYLNGANNCFENGNTDGQFNGEVHKAATLKKALDEFLLGKSIKTVYGPVPLAHALDWPIFASYDELAGCASWMGGRIPSADEVQSIYAYAEELKAEEAAKTLGKTIPAVNSHLVNDGVEETPPSKTWLNGFSNTASGPDPHHLFADLEGCNVGFKHWHPTSVTQNGNRLCGRGDMGGVWEWTSTVLEKHAGFEAMPLYPGYTADFFDKKHYLVLGGSWATHPRVAGRKTFVNWYQRNYAYVWAGARCRNTVAVHHQRHRQIAETLRELKSIDNEDGVTDSASPDSASVTQIQAANEHQETAERDEGSPGHRKRANPPAAGDDDGQTSLQRKDSKKIRKAANKLSKALLRPKVITAKDIEHVAITLHQTSVSANDNGSKPDVYTVSEDLRMDTDVTNNLQLTKSVIDAQEARRTFVPYIASNKSTSKVSGHDMIPEQEVTRILIELGVSHAVSTLNRTSRGLMERLLTDVKDDLLKFRTEQRETAMRKAGYWRYMNKRVFSNMAANNEIVDWQTGEKLVASVDSAGSSADLQKPKADTSNEATDDSEEQWEFATAYEAKESGPIERLERARTIAELGNKELDGTAVKTDVQPCNYASETSAGRQFVSNPTPSVSRIDKVDNVALREVSNNVTPQKTMSSKKGLVGAVSGLSNMVLPPGTAAGDLVRNNTQHAASSPAEKTKKAIPSDIAAKELVTKITRQAGPLPTAEKKQAAPSDIAAKRLVARITQGDGSSILKTEQPAYNTEQKSKKSSATTDVSGVPADVLQKVGSEASVGLKQIPSQSADKHLTRSAVDAATQPIESKIPVPVAPLHKTTVTRKQPSAALSSLLTPDLASLSLHKPEEVEEEEESVYLFRVFRKGPFTRSKAQQELEREIPKYGKPAFMLSEKDVQDFIQFMHIRDLEDRNGEKKGKVVDREDRGKGVDRD